MTLARDAAGQVDIVIVNWNAGALLARCLDSIAAHGAGRVGRVVVVDNASRDGSEQAADLGRPGLDMLLVRNTANRGFGAACNQGAALGQAGFILFLNPDAALRPGTLDLLLDVLHRPDGEDVGIVGPRLLAQDGSTHRSCARLPSLSRLVLEPTGLDRLLPGLIPPHFMVEWDHLDDRDVPQVMGAALMVRRSTFGDLGGFDERFFVYYEDVDLCRRAWGAGWRCRHVAGATADHLGQGTTRQAVAMRGVLLARSRISYAAKHFGSAAALLVCLSVLLVEPWSRTALGIARRSPGDVRAAWRAAGTLWSDLPGLLLRVRHGGRAPA